MKTTYLTTLAIGLGMTANLWGLPEWNIDFEGMDVGEPPETMSYQSGVVNTFPQTSTTSGDSTVLIQEDYTPATPGADTMPGKSVVFNYVPNPDAPPQWTAQLQMIGNADATPASNFLIGFDILVDSSSFSGSGLHSFDLRLQDTSNAILTRVLFENAGNIRLLRSATELDVTFNDVWSVDTLHRIELLYNGSTGTYSVFVDGNSVGSASYDASVDLQSITLGNMRFLQGSNNLGWTGAIDNILVTIPEPGTAVLSLLGLCALLRRYR